MILLGVTIAASIWLVLSNLKRDVVLVPVRTAGGKEPSGELAAAPSVCFSSRVVLCSILLQLKVIEWQQQRE